VPGINVSVSKALDMLDLLGQAESGLRLKDIAERLDLPESTAHRLLASLADRNFVRQQRDHGTYTLGWKITILARGLGSDARLAQEMRPYLEDLARRLGQTINLGVLGNDAVVYLDCQIPSQSMALYTAPGATIPVHASAMGKILLAFMSPDDREALLDRVPLSPITPHTVASRDALHDALAGIRAHGYAFDLGEFKPEVSCLAAPVLNDRGLAIAAVSMTAPTNSLPPDWRDRYPPRLLAITQEASANLFGAVQPREPATPIM
jgi:DNA-binding IclR family transcriptional regulator